MNDELLYRIALTQIPLIGAVTAKNLLSYCGSAEAVFRASRAQLMKVPGVGAQLADRISRYGSIEAAEREWAYIEQHDIRVLCHTDHDYPRRLRQLHDGPFLLYYKGNADLNAARIVAIVGTRKPTPYGQNFCAQLVADLAAYDVLVVSGLAYGIDVVAHRKCLEVGIPTVGVLAHGLDRIYPPAHQSVAQKMVHYGGLLSEYPSGTRPERERFPIRNRIVAGMADAVVVVETARRGGSLITAQLAEGYNRDVFAVPGRIDDKHAQGCNYLIKTHRAALIESATDIAYIMNWQERSTHEGIQRQLFVSLSEEEQRVLAQLDTHAPLPVDVLSWRLNLSGSQLAALLLELEFKGLIRTLPGKRYVRL